MQQRSANVETNPEKWDVSTAGHVSAGQTSIESAIRELSEEVGMNIDKSELKYVLTYKNSKFLRNYIDNQFYDFYIVNKDKIKTEDIVVQESEVKQIKLCNLKEVNKMIEEQEVVPRPEVYKELLKYLR